MQTALPELDPALPVTLEEKKQRQRLHVRRSYYRKLNRMNEMREHVRQLKAQYALALQQHALQPEDASSSSDQNPSPSSSRDAAAAAASSGRAPVELYAELARVKEQLLEENAALQQLLAEQNAHGFRLDQLHREFQSDLAKSVADELQDETHFMFPPMSVGECQQLALRSYDAARQFLQSKACVSTGATAFGWRDRRRLESDRLQFSLQKRFAHASPHAMAQRSWELFSSCKRHAALYTSSLRVSFCVPQVVDANNFVALRVFSTPGGAVVAKSLFLVSRFQAETGPVIIFRSADKNRLRRRYEGSFADPTTRADEPPVHWLQDVFTWTVFSEAGDDCALDFGGDIPGTMDYGKEVWMLEVLLIALRWESKINGSLFTIAA